MIRLTLSTLLFLFALVIYLNAETLPLQPGPSPRPTTESQTEQSKTGNTNTQTDQQPAPLSPTGIQVLESPKFKSESNNARTNSNYEERQYRLSIWLTWFTGILAAFTVLLVLVSAYQGCQLWRSVQITKVAADAAKNSAQTARKSLEISRRAYVHVEAVHILEPLIAGHNPVVEFIIRNTGMTPAKALMIDVGGEISTHKPALNTPRDVDEIAAIASKTGAGLILPPNGFYKQRLDTWGKEPLGIRGGLTEEKVVKVREGALFWNCWAAISYLDQFEDSQCSVEPFAYDPARNEFQADWLGYYLKPEKAKDK